MKRLIYIYFVEAFFLFYLVSMGMFHRNNAIYSITLIGISSFEFLYYFYKCNKRECDFKMIYLFCMALLLRLGIMYYDISISTIEVADSGDYRKAAEYFFHTNMVSFRGGGFSMTTLFMGIIYKIFGLQRILLPYTGTMCFMGACYLTNELLKKLEVRNIIRYISMFWMLFTPQNLEITSLSNREGYIIFFTTLSIYYLVLWWESEKNSLIIKGILAMFAAMLFHSGVVAIFCGYIMIIAFYDRKNKKLRIKWNTVVMLLVLFMVFGSLFVNFKDTLFVKFQMIDEISDISGRAGYTEIGGSTYHVPGEGASSLVEILLYTPIRSVYFLLSPMPWYWRGISDVVAFVLCSVPHIIIIILFCRIAFKQREKDQRKSLLIALFISAIAIAVVFGWGVKNTGTAIRHRDKFLCLYTILMALEMDMWFCKHWGSKYKKGEEKCKK